MGKDKYTSFRRQLIRQQKNRLAEKIRAQGNDHSPGRHWHQTLRHRMYPVPAVFITKKINSFMGPGPFLPRCRPPELPFSIAHARLKEPAPEGVAILRIGASKKDTEPFYTFHLFPDPQGTLPVYANNHPIKQVALQIYLLYYLWYVSLTLIFSLEKLLMKTVKERRQHHRFDALVNILAFNTMSFGQVINMSMGGLRIRYILRLDEPFRHSFEISILNNAGDQYIDGLSCKVASCTDYGPISPSLNLFTREVGVMFTNLTPSQKNKLADFLRHNTLTNA